ncbi:MAG: alcohol dehydrogenase catalytic domain-containing protein [Lachnospiraceae bacterium]|nr:alcohol dehydrogenase catalytic domain-containing protein [Lachnospiraceae bacterium]
MKGVVYNGKEALFRDDLPVPSPCAAQSRVRVSYGGVCSTDREVLKGYRPDFRGVMGHEFVGVVESSSDPAWVGKTVVGELNAGCGRCLYCRTGREKHCPDRKVMGMAGKDGCFAEYLVVETRLLHPVPPGLPMADALWTEPLAAALEVPRQVHIDPGTCIAVIGDGRLAYLCASVLHLYGVDLTVVGKHASKLERFAGLGKTALIPEPEGEGAFSDTYEVVVEASGSPSGLELASRLVRRQGTIVLKSTYAGRATVDMSQFVVNEVTIVGSRCGPFGPALRLLEKGLIKLPPTEFYRLEEQKAAFDSRSFKAGFCIGGPE